MMYSKHFEPQPSSRLLLLRNFQPLATPDSLHSTVPYVPAGFAQLDGDAAITVPAKAVSQCDDGPGQCVFVIPLCRLVALRATRLVNQVARMSLTRPALPCMLHCGAPTLRA